MTTATATAPYPAPDIAAAIAHALAAAIARPDPGFDAGCSPQKYAGIPTSTRIGTLRMTCAPACAFARNSPSGFMNCSGPRALRRMIVSSAGIIPAQQHAR